MTVGGTERMLSLINKKAAMAKMLEAEERISPKLNTEGQLMPEEVVKRTTSSPENVTVTIGSPGSNLLQIQYAYWTQQGWYPDGKSLIRERIVQKNCLYSLFFSLFRPS